MVITAATATRPAAVAARSRRRSTPSARWVGVHRLSRRWQGCWREREAEQLELPIADEQHWRRPFHWVDLDVDRFATFGHGRVDGSLAADQVGVELLAEGDRGDVTDRELHRDDRWDAQLDQCGGHPRIRVGQRRAGALTGVQHDQAQIVLIVEQVGEHRAVDGRGGSVQLWQEQHALTLRREVAVTDVVKDVVAAVAQRLTEAPRGGRLQPVQLHSSERRQARQGLARRLDVPHRRQAAATRLDSR